MRPRFALAVLTLSATGFALLKAPEPVQACAVVLPKGSSPNSNRVDVADETAVIVWDAAAKVEHFIRQASFASSSAEIGFLVPTPSRPEVAESSPAAFADLARVTAPRKEIRTKTRVTGVGCGAEPQTFDRVGAALAPNAAPGGVQVLERSRVGVYDYAILKAEDPADLREWLGKNGFDARPELETWLKVYTKGKWFLTAFKLAADAANGARLNGALTVHASAVRLSLPTDRPFYPYREPEDMQLGFGRPGAVGPVFGNRMLRVYVLAENKVDGVLGTSGGWPGHVVWAGPVEATKASAALTAGKLPAGLAGRDWYLTEFEDRSFPRPGTDEVYFDRALDPSPVERPPDVIYEYRDVPVEAVAGVMCAAGAVLLVGTWLLIRRLTKPHR